MELIELNKIFHVKSGNKFDANKMEFIDYGDINFISRESKNNGCVGTVKEHKGIKPFEEGLITVSLGGSFLLSSFVQPKKFYTAQNVAVLIPIKEMNVNEKIFYCKCISMNRFRYSPFGREANRTLKILKIPKEMPAWVTKKGYTFSTITEPIKKTKLSLTTGTKWGVFRFDKIFNIKKGKRIVVSKTKDKGNCPFVSSIEKNNGIHKWLNVNPNHKRNTITVNYNGSVGEAFYQPMDFWASDDVNVLCPNNEAYPEFKLNQYIAMFLIVMIKKEKYRFNYGRKWHKERMEESLIRLPIDEKGNPNWRFMEDYIKGLRYSKELGIVSK